jgi:hypothetical protein
MWDRGRSSLIGGCEEREDDRGDGGHDNDGCLGSAPAAIVESWDQADPRGGRVRGNGVGRRRRLGWPTGAPFSGGMGMEGLAMKACPRHCRGVVGLGRSPWRTRS